jgi:hypothetical protein
MLSTFDRAALAVASACAIASSFVKVVTVDPLATLPEKLFLLTFGNVGIDDDAHLATFRTSLVSLLPDKVKPGAQRMPLTRDVMIGLVVNHVDALIAQVEA